MANKIQYGLEFNTSDMEKLLKLAEKLDKSMKDANKAITEQAKIEGKKQLEEFKTNEKIRLYIEKKNLKEKDNLLKQATRSKVIALNQEKNMTAFAEKELINIKKQALLMNKKLNKTHLKELEDLYRDYYKRIKGLDDKTSTALAKGQVDNVQKRQGIQAKANNVAIRVGKYLATSTLVYQGLGVLKSGRDAIIDYDQALNSTYAAMKGVTEQEKLMIRSMTQNSDLVAKYGKSYVEQAQAMEVLVKTGLKLTEASIVLEPALKLAAAGDMDLKESSEALTQSLRNLGKPMGYATELTDALAYGAAASAVNVKDLIVSLEGVGAAGTTFGMEAKDIVAWIGALGNVGLKGREAANAISRMWLRITKPQKEVTALLKKGGIELFEGVGNEKRIRSFEKIMDDLSNSTLSLAEKQKLLGVHAFKTGEQIQSAVISYKNIAFEMQRVNDEADRMASQKMEGLGGKIDKMKAQWDSIFISQNGISMAMGFAVDKLSSFLKLLADNPEIVKLVAIAGSTLAGAGVGTMIGGAGVGTGVGAVTAFIAAVAVLSGMDTTRLYTQQEIDRMTKQAKDFQESFSKWQIDYENSLTNLKTHPASKLKTDLNEANKELNKLNSAYKALTDERNKKEDEYKRVTSPKFREQSFIADESGVTFKEAEKKASRELKIANQALDIFNQKYYEKAKVSPSLISKEITRRKGSGVDDFGGGSGKDKEQRIDDLKDYIDKMQKLQREADEIELTGLAKKIKDINNQYETLNADLNRRIEENKEKDVITTREDIARKENEIARKKELESTLQRHRDELNKKHLEKEKELADKLLEVEKQAQEKSLENIQEYQQAKIDAAERMKSLAEQYGNAVIKQDINRIDEARAIEQLQKDAAIIGANNTEELITEIKRSHADQRIQIAYEAWQKEYQFSSAVMGSIGSAYDTMAQTLTDIDMNGKDRREAIWEGFRSTAITAIMDVAKQKIIAWGMEMAFEGTKEATTATAIATKNATIGATAGVAAAPVAALAAATMSLAIAENLLAFGAPAAAATGPLAAYTAVAGTLSALSAGFPVADAIVADGKVHPYRKDDLVMIGTGLGSKSNAKLPTQAMGNGGSIGMQGNMAMMRELQQIRLAVASGNASIAQAVADNVPTFTGEVLSPVKVYKRTLIGERDANFIVKN